MSISSGSSRRVPATTGSWAAARSLPPLRALARLAVLAPKGMIIWNILEDVRRRENAARGYLEVKTPLLDDEQTYETSGSCRTTRTASSGCTPMRSPTGAWP